MSGQTPPWGEVGIEDNGVAGVFPNGIHWNNYEKTLGGARIMVFETWDPSKPAAKRHTQNKFTDMEEHAKAVEAAWKDNNDVA